LTCGPFFEKLAPNSSSKLNMTIKVQTFGGNENLEQVVHLVDSGKLKSGL
jgi:hypothetical protein